MKNIEARKMMILNDNALKAIIKLALPLMLGNLIQTLYNITDAYWVGKLGYIEFSAISFVWPITFIFLAFSLGMSGAATSLIGQAIGSNRSNIAKDIVAQFFLISLVSGTIFAFLGYLLTPHIIGVMGATGDLYTYSVAYLQILFFEMPILFMYYVYKSMREGSGDTKSPMILLAISVVLNMLLDPLFILVFSLGVKGAAYATVLSKLCVVWYMIYKMFSPTQSIHISLKSLKFNKAISKNLFGIGLPSALGQTSSAFGFLVMNAFIVAYGDKTLAAFGLGNRITSLVMMPAFGLGAALAAFIGQNIGAKQYMRAKAAVFSTMALGFFVLSLGSVIIYFFRTDLITIFIDDPGVIALSTRYMTVLSFVFPLMAIYQSMMGAFQGSGHTKYVFFLTLSRLWLLRIPMVLFSRAFTSLGSDGIWYAMLLSNVIVCTIGIITISRGNWLKSTLYNS